VAARHSLDAECKGTGLHTSSIGTDGLNIYPLPLLFKPGLGNPG
jgi:hypothetical protein